MIKHLKFLLPAIGEKESRRNLMWVKCQVKDGYLHMFAADGFIIKTVKTDIGIDADFLSEDKEFYIDREAVENAIKIGEYQPDKKCCGGCFENCIEERKLFKTEIQKDRIRIPFKNVEIKYKPYESEYPNLDCILKSKEKDQIVLEQEIIKIDKHKYHLQEKPIH